MTIDWNNYVGIDFDICGRGNNCDCWGLLCRLYHDEYDIDLPSYDNEYFRAMDPAIPGIVGREAEKWQRVETPGEGDAVVMKIGGWPRHVGIVIKPGWMLHALKGANSCIERYDTPKWNKRIDGFYRHTARCQ